MSEELETVGADVTDNTDNQPANKMVTIRLNNRDVAVPQSAADILRQTEHDLKSGYDKKLRDERAQIDSEWESKVKLFEQDKAWLNEAYAKYPEAAKYYEPLVDGGRGYVGAPSLLTGGATKVTNMPTQPINTGATAFNVTDPKLKEIDNTLKSLKDDLYNEGLERANRAFALAMAKYPYADKDAMGEKFENYFFKNKKHPTDTFIEAAVKASHEHVTNKVGVAKKVDPATLKRETVLPDVTGKPSSPTQKPAQSLDDRDAFEAWIEEGLRSAGAT